MLRLISSIAVRGKLSVLRFHKVPRQAHVLSESELDLAGFERVLGTVAASFRILPLDEALRGLRAGNLPPRAACLTFDEGYPDWRDGVVPLLEKQGVHATFFVACGQFHGLPLWHERILHAVAHALPDVTPFRLEGTGLSPLDMNSVAQRRDAVCQLEEFLRYQVPADREHWLLALEQHAGHDRARVPSLSTDELRALHGRGFGIGAQTATLPVLSRCTDAQANDEIAGARESLESIIRGKVTAFAYPNGLPGRDFRPEHIEMVKRAGYSCALTTGPGAARGDTSMFQIPRTTLGGGLHASIRQHLFQQPQFLKEAGDGRKAALMVAFHFPPQAGSSGILRTLNFVKYLPRFGWSPSVLTARPMAYQEQRNDLVDSVPAQTRIVRAAALDTARHLSIGGRYLRATALPDRWATWWLPAVLAGLREIRRQRPDLIWTTYPISTTHLIGAALSRWSKLPWVADFRDPMVSGASPSDRLQRKVWMRLERHVLQHATACVFTTARAAEAYGLRYPDAAHKCHVIENGFDEEAFEGLSPVRVGIEPGTRLMLHSGLIYPQDRDPSTFFAAVRKLIDERHLSPDGLCIRFRAPYHDDLVMACARAERVEDWVEVAPPVSYNEAIAEMMGADLLLVFQGSHFNAQIPAKIYEYLRAQRPLLAILDPLGDTATQLRQFEGVHLADIAYKADVKAKLLNCLSESGSEREVRALENNRVAVVARYSRKAQTERLSHLFDAACGLNVTI